MLKPKTIANTSIGTATYTASVGPSRPNNLEPTPCWNTSTVIPKAPATDRQFITMAFSGTRID